VEEIQRFLRKISPIEIAILVFYGKKIWRYKLFRGFEGNVFP